VWEPAEGSVAGAIDAARICGEQGINTVEVALASGAYWGGKKTAQTGPALRERVPADRLLSADSQSVFVSLRASCGQDCGQMALSASFLKGDKRNSGEAGELVVEVVPRSTDWHGD
jgi:hypothetical protein